MIDESRAANCLLHAIETRRVVCWHSPYSACFAITAIRPALPLAIRNQFLPCVLAGLDLLPALPLVIALGFLLHKRVGRSGAVISGI
jgi:hypothetical protein